MANKKLVSTKSQIKKSTTKNLDNLSLKKRKFDAFVVFRNLWNYLKSNNRQYLFLSSVLVGGLGLFYGNVGYISFVALIPLFIYIHSSQNLSRKQLMFDFYIAGLIICLFAYYFLSQSTLETWAVGINGLLLFFIPFLTQFLLSVVSALAALVLGLVVYYIKPKLRIYSLVILWPLAELLRSELFMIINYGPGGSLTPNFNFGALAIHASGTSLLYISRFVGFLSHYLDQVGAAP